MAASPSGVTLPGTSASVPEARRFVRSTLQAWELEDLAESASLVVSELATNVVLHARSSFTVRLEPLGDGAVRLEVVDASPRRPDARAHTAEASTGRGLLIVAELAASWGVRPDGAGKAVWAVLDRVETGGGFGPGARSARGSRRTRTLAVAPVDGGPRALAA